MIAQTYNEAYISEHVRRFNRATAEGKHALAVDSLWRIASNADLYSVDELNTWTVEGMPISIQDEILDWLEDEGFEVED